MCDDPSNSVARLGQTRENMYFVDNGQLRQGLVGLVTHRLGI
jgi:hypothetical protein